MLLLIVPLFLLFIYYKIIKPHNYWRDRGVDGPKPWPIIGNIGRYVFRISNFTDSLKELYDANPDKRYVGIYQFLMPTLLIRDPDLIKKITIKEFDSFADQSGLFSEQNDNLAKKILLNLNQASGWQDMRSILSPAFTSSKMKMMFGFMDECADNLVNYFLQQKDDVIKVEVSNTFNRISNDIIASTAFGVQCDSLKDRDNEFYLIGTKAVERTGLKSLQMFLSSLSPIIDKLMNVRFVDADVEAFFVRIVKETIKYREENNIVRHDMLHLMLEARKNRLNIDNQKEAVDDGFSVVQESELTANKKVKTKLTDEDITAQAIQFFIGGFEPSSLALSYVTNKLALNPDVQRKLQQEIDETYLQCKGKLTYEALLKMKYLDCVISENLRSISLFLGRKTTKPFTIEPELPGEVRLYIEKGTVIWIPSYAIHFDAKYFPNPKKFDPERFTDDYNTPTSAQSKLASSMRDLSAVLQSRAALRAALGYNTAHKAVRYENKHNIQPNTYMPFGAGPRNCIGSRYALLQVKLVLVKLLKDFDVVPVKETVVDLKPSKGAFNIVPTEGVWLGFTKRK